MEHYRINVLEPLLLFQTTAPMLLKTKPPKFVIFSSGAGKSNGIERLKVKKQRMGSPRAP